MTEDHKTFHRATQASLAALAASVLITAALTVLALWGDHAAITAAAWHALPAIALWVCLWIVYQQHRLERIESLEASQLAARHGGDTSIFETSPDDLNVARRRLDWLYRWIVPLTSIASAAYLLIMGFFLGQKGLSLLATPVRSPAAAPENSGMLIAFFAGLALVAFLMSRYLAGMAKLGPWQLLRGGAAYLMGIVLVAVMLVAALGLARFDIPSPLRFMPVIIPAVMILIGLEITLNFILNFYRPRKPGEMPRPAFDSRLLSLLTAPESIAHTINEAINYQFGFEITRSWFWQLLSRAAGWLAVLAVVVLAGMSCFVIVGPSQRAIVTRMGAISSVGLEPGLHLKLPWPLADVRYYDVSTIRSVSAGSELKLKADVPAILWTGDHTETAAEPLIVAPSRRLSDGLPDQLSTPQVSLLKAEVLVYYQVDPAQLLNYVQSNPAVDDDDPANDGDHLTHIAQRVIAAYLLRHDIDAWIGSARVTATDDMTRLIQLAADEARLGLRILDVVITGVHPPQNVADKFHEVVTAEQEKLTAIQIARQEATRILTEVAGSNDVASGIIAEIQKLEDLKLSRSDATAIAQQELLVEQRVRQAGGTAAVRIAQAQADRWRIENRERGKAAMFAPQLAAFQLAPRLYQASGVLQALADTLKNPRKIVVVGDRENLTIRGDFKDVPDALGTAFQEIERTNR
jgi:regulator of protease activity HflC (stomatin/prohibitin superfamily)